MSQIRDKKNMLRNSVGENCPTIQNADKYDESMA